MAKKTLKVDDDFQNDELENQISPENVEVESPDLKENEGKSIEDLEKLLGVEEPSKDEELKDPEELEKLGNMNELKEQEVEEEQLVEPEKEKSNPYEGITKENIVKGFVMLQEGLAQLELEQRAKNKPYKYAFYLRKRLEILEKGAKRNL